MINMIELDRLGGDGKITIAAASIACMQREEVKVNGKIEECTAVYFPTIGFEPTIYVRETPEQIKKLIFDGDVYLLRAEETERMTQGF